MAPVTGATQVIRCQACRPLSLPPTGVGYCSQMCAHHLSCSRQVGGGPRWEGTTALLCNVTKAPWLGTNGRRPSWTPFLSTGPGNKGTVGLPTGPFLDTRVHPTPTSLSLVALHPNW